MIDLTSAIIVADDDDDNHDKGDREEKTKKRKKETCYHLYTDTDTGYIEKQQMTWKVSLALATSL